MKTNLKLLAAVLAIASCGAHASAFTNTSPAGGLLPSGITTLGGVVLDLIGTNGNRVTSQLGANGLPKGLVASYPLIIGTQTGFTSDIRAALGGGLQAAAIRMTVYDGDTGAGEFAFDDLTLLIDDIVVANWSDIKTQETDAFGNKKDDLFNDGFRDISLDSGWALISTGSLTGLFNKLFDETVVFSTSATIGLENELDFTAGLDNPITKAGVLPFVTYQNGHTVPEPGSTVLFGLGLLSLTFLRWRRPVP